MDSNPTSTVMEVQQRKIYIFTLDGNIVPKARPRVTRNGTYMPPNYTAWKDLAILLFRLQATDQGIVQPLKKITGKIKLFGKHYLGSDGDNIKGAIWDAMVQGGILRGDNLKCIPDQSIKLFYSNQPPTSKIIIRPLP